jgi:hypothetical protein
VRWLVLLLVACSNVHSTPGDDTSEATLAITIEKRHTVYGVRSIEVALKNNGVTTLDRIELNDLEFPAVYHVTTEGKDGALEITIEAQDGVGTIVGRGTSSTTFGTEAAGVMLEGVDFVVNSVHAGNQFTTNDFEAVGLQIAAGGFQNTWTIGFRDECTTCTIYGRSFDDKGSPINGGGQIAFATMVTNASTPALAGGFEGSIAVWDTIDPNTSGSNVVCRPVSFGPSGPAVTIATEPSDVVTAAPRLFGNGYVVTWQSFMASQVVRSMIVTSDCVPVTTTMTVSTTSGTSGARRSHVAAADFGLVYAWIVDGELHARIGLEDGTFTSGDLTLIRRTATQQVDYVRVVRWGDANLVALAVRWTSNDGVGPGKIEVYPMMPGGTLGPAMLVTDASGSDFTSAKAFGLAARYDGRLMVVWHACPTGQGSCEVYGRYVARGGVVGETFVVPTTTAADQTNPSVALVNDAFVVAWTDSSASAPDTSGTAVRARIMVPGL